MEYIKSIEINNVSESLDILKAAGTEELFEKAKRQVGDIHPNGKWVWTEYAPGKFDWKSKKGKYHKNKATQSSQSATQSKQSSTSSQSSSSKKSSTIDMTKFLVKENPNLTTAPRKLEDMDDDYLNKLNDHVGKLAFMGSSRHRENFRKWGELIRAEISSRKKQNNKSTKQASKKQTNLIGPNKIKKGDKMFDVESNIVATVDSYDESKKKYYVTMKDDTGNFSWYVSADKLKDIETIKEETQESAKREVKKLMKEKKSEIEEMTSALRRAVNFEHKSFSHMMRLDRGITCKMHFEARTSTTKTIDDKVKSQEYEYLATDFNSGDKYKNNVLYRGNKPLKEEELKSLIEKFAEETANRAVKKWWGNEK